MNLLDEKLESAARERARRKALAKNIAFKRQLCLHKMLERQEQMKLRCASIAAGAAWIAVAVQLFR